MEDRLRAGRLASLFLVILVALFLAAYGCSGGGGGGGGGIEYTGVTTQAVIDDTNSEDLTQGAYIGGSAGSAMIGLGAVSQSGVNDRPRYLNLAGILKNAINQVDVNAPDGIVESGAIIQESDSIIGDCGGSASYVISLNDQTGDFTGSFTFSSYCSEGVIISGSASFSGDYDDVNSEFVGFSIITSGLTVTSGGDSFTTSGNISFNFQASPATVTADVMLRDNTTGEVSWVDNYSLTVTEGPNYEDITFSGRFYHPIHGYVGVSTPTAFRIFDGDIWPSQGVLLVDGAGGAKARLTADPSFSYRVEADTDGDGDFDDYDSGLVSW